MSDRVEAAAKALYEHASAGLSTAPWPHLGNSEVVANWRARARIALDAADAAADDEFLVKLANGVRDAAELARQAKDDVDNTPSPSLSELALVSIAISLASGMGAVLEALRQDAQS